MNTSLESDLLFVIQDRAKMFAEVRAFFHERDVLEVDCPSLSLCAPIDAHIDVMKVYLQSGKSAFLHTSPEYGMKRLIALTHRDIFQMSHVFRDGELGKRHNPEFTMVEWYRLNISLETLIQETLSFIRLFLPDLHATSMTYCEAFEEYAKINPFKAKVRELIKIAESHEIHLSDEMRHSDKDSLLNLIMSLVIEPHLGKDCLCVITDYPASQAALSQIKKTQEFPVAERFEVYYNGFELANGYHELLDEEEQRKRLIAENEKRISHGKDLLPIDEEFLAALKIGLPDCCGVAAGFDRLMMVKHQKESLSEILPFPWPT
ncbi:MAG: EF-P lysine aminoacylase GenX [Chlamydiae bacterium]|nr:EF-P lysine aminoacylase GenX [Chlamydiota bacterium]